MKIECLTDKIMSVYDDVSEENSAVIYFEIVGSIMNLIKIELNGHSYSDPHVSLLFKAALNYCHERLIDGVVLFEFVPDAMREDFVEFLLKNNFPILYPREQITTIDLKSKREDSLGKMVPDSSFIAQLQPVSSLTEEYEDYYTNKISPTIMSENSREDVRGNIVDGLSYAVCRNGRIMAYSIFVEIDGQLNLDAVYIAKDSPKDLIMLIKYSFDLIRERYMMYDTVTVNAVQEEGMLLLDKLTEGLECRREYLYCTSMLV